MELSSILLSIVLILGGSAICVILFERLGFGSVLGFIITGILIGPYTPGPAVAAQSVAELQTVAQIGVVLFLFTVGLEMRPQKMWSMRRLLFGLGSAQMLVTAALASVYFVFLLSAPWAHAIVVGFGVAMSSTAIVMATLGERGELSAEHGQSSFAILMAQDLWVVPVMSMVPILAHQTAPETATPLWETALLVVVVLAGIFARGLPAACHIGLCREAPPDGRICNCSFSRGHCCGLGS